MVLEDHVEQHPRTAAIRLLPGKRVPRVHHSPLHIPLLDGLEGEFLVVVRERAPLRHGGLLGIPQRLDHLLGHCAVQNQPRPQPRPWRPVRDQLQYGHAFRRLTLEFGRSQQLGPAGRRRPPTGNAVVRKRQHRAAATDRRMVVAARVIVGADAQALHLRGRGVTASVEIALHF